MKSSNNVPRTLRELKSKTPEEFADCVLALQTHTADDLACWLTEFVDTWSGDDIVVPESDTAAHIILDMLSGARRFNRTLAISAIRACVIEGLCRCDTCGHFEDNVYPHRDHDKVCPDCLEDYDRRFGADDHEDAGYSLGARLLDFYRGY